VGNEAAIRDRIAAQYKAGATHVCITAVRSEGSAGAWSLATGGSRERATPEERTSGARTAMNWLIQLVIGIPI